MKTDKEFYKLFKAVPEMLFEIAGRGIILFTVETYDPKTSPWYVLAQGTYPWIQNPLNWKQNLNF